MVDETVIEISDINQEEVKDDYIDEFWPWIYFQQ